MLYSDSFIIKKKMWILSYYDSVLYTMTFLRFEYHTILSPSDILYHNKALLLVNVHDIDDMFYDILQ